jgi:hypothetical protein
MNGVTGNGRGEGAAWKKKNQATVTGTWNTGGIRANK